MKRVLIQCSRGWPKEDRQLLLVAVRYYPNFVWGYLVVAPLVILWGLLIRLGVL